MCGILSFCFLLFGVGGGRLDLEREADFSLVFVVVVLVMVL